MHASVVLKPCCQLTALRVVCMLLVPQAAADGQAFPVITASKAEVVDAAVAWVHEAIAADRKVGALKQLQGHVWRTGFKKGQLTAELFRWVCSRCSWHCVSTRGRVCALGGVCVP